MSHAGTPCPSSNSASMLTPASQEGLLRLVLVDSLVQESQKEDIDLPSIPDTSGAARELIPMTVQSPELVPQRGTVLPWGKLLLLRHCSSSPRHRFLALSHSAPPWSPRSESSSDLEV